MRHLFETQIVRNAVRTSLPLLLFYISFLLLLVKHFQYYCRTLCNVIGQLRIKLWTNETGRDLSLSPPSAACMRQEIGSALVQIMVCRLFGAKPLSKPMMGYCQLQPGEQILIKLQNFSLTKMHLKISSAKWQPLCPGGDELKRVSDGYP